MTMILDGTNGEVFPSWTTGTRPSSPVAGQVGWNTTIGSLENYNGSAWTAVGGGGAGQWQSVQASNFAATSGNAYAINTTSAAITVTLPASPSVGNYIQIVDYAGTWSTNPVTLNPNGLKINGSTSNVVLSTSRQGVAVVYIDSTQGWICYSQGSSIGPYSINYLLVAGGGGGTNDVGGGGGAGGLLNSTLNVTPGTAYTITIGSGGGNNTNGTNSTISSLVTSIGGGHGGAADQPGVAGGSGGGGGRQTNPGGAGTSGQGYAGGSGTSYLSPVGGGGGGGGASQVGFSNNSGGSNGGAGLVSSISGSSVTYAGGGGGGTYQSGVYGIGGAGGGGNGGGGSGVNGSPGSANTGGGGGGGSAAAGQGAQGGSGICIISYPGTQRGTGGTITSSGGNTIHTFTTSGTYTA